MTIAKVLILSCHIYYKINRYSVETKISTFRPNLGYFVILKKISQLQSVTWFSDEVLKNILHKFKKKTICLVADRARLLAL